MHIYIYIHIYMYIYKYIYTCQIKEATFGGYCPFHILKKVALFQCVYVHIMMTVYILIWGGYDYQAP